MLRKKKLHRKRINSTIIILLIAILTACDKSHRSTVYKSNYIRSLSIPIWIQGDWRSDTPEVGYRFTDTQIFIQYYDSSGNPAKYEYETSNRARAPKDLPCFVDANDKYCRCCCRSLQS